MRYNLIFDLDGTLIDSNAICVAILQEMLDERGGGATIVLAEAAQHMSRGGAHMVAALLGESCHDPDLDLQEFRERYARRLTPSDSIFGGVTQGLARLAEAGYGLAICSNKPQNLCLKVLEDTALLPFFDVVIGGRPGLRTKPAPDMLEAVVRELDADVSCCAYIGDSEIDHRVATDVGMSFCYMTYGYGEPGWLPQSTWIFDHFNHLTAALVSSPQMLFAQWQRAADAA